MVSLIVFLYLIVSALFLVFYKKLKRKNFYLKAKVKRLGAIKIVKANLFCSVNSLSFKLFNFLSSGLFIFDKQNKFNDCYKVLAKSGIDINLPVYKYEFYNSFKNASQLENFYNTLKTIKKLDQKNIAFNFFVFFNDHKNYRAINKLIKHFKLKYVQVRVYHCCEIDYNLLSAINIIDLNKHNNQNLKLQKTFVNNKALRHINNNMKNNNDKNIKTLKPNGFFLQKDEDIFCFDKFNYSSYYLSTTIEQKGFSATLSKTFDYLQSIELFKLTIKNYNSTTQTFKSCFGTKFKPKIFKNAFYTVMQSNYKTCIISHNTGEQNKTLLGNFNKKGIEDNYFYAVKKLTIKPFESVDFYFAFSKSDNIFNKEDLSNLNLKYETNWKNYSSLKLPKALSKNKTLNYLVNDFLPQKIIEGTIKTGEKTNDFECLLNKTFNRQNIDKSLINKNFNLYFLTKNNLFKTYFNLLYFYFGVWQCENGVYLNSDKTLIENKTIVVCLRENNFFNLNISNTQNSSEVEIDKIKFSNLKLISFDLIKNKKDINLVF